MDFVVVGVGVGALGILLGVLLHGWLAARCERAAQRAVDPAAVAFERASAAESRRGGQAFLAAGAAVVLATVGALAGGLDDRSGALLVTTTATVAAVGIIVWGFLHRSRHPMPPRPRRQQDLASVPGNLLASHVSGVQAHAAEPAPAVWDEKPVLAAQESGSSLTQGESPVHDARAEPVAAELAGGHPAVVEHDDASRQGDDAVLNGQPAASAAPGKILAFVGREDRVQEADLKPRDDNGGGEH